MRNRIDPADTLLAAARARLAEARGPVFWRSLEELAETDEFQHYLPREFPEQASEWDESTSRRQFFRVMAASLALAGVTGCGIQPQEAIVPYVEQPEKVVPGKPLSYATSLPLYGNRAFGVLVQTHEGRPTKVEGNPDHPASLGGTDPLAQAAILSLYDPDRSQVVTQNGRISTWDDFLVAISTLRRSQGTKKGAGLRLLTGAITSPTLASHIRAILKEFPEAKWHQYEPVSRDGARAGARLTFGRDVEPIHHLDRADVILSLDADFLSWNPARVPDSRAFTSRREPGPGKRPNRLYVAEPTPSITGAMADHRLPATSGQVGQITRAVARSLGVSVAGKEAGAPDPHWVAAVINDLKKAPKGSTLVLAGEGQPPEVHALAHAINGALGNIGKTIEFIDPVEAEPIDQAESLRSLVGDLESGKVDALFILGGNPVYDTPGEIGFEKALGKVLLSVHLSQHEDETSARCLWHIPEAHPFEAWGDLRSFDGSYAIQQPLIQPLYGGRTALDVVLALSGHSGRPNLEVLREYWKTQHSGDGFDAFWEKSLHDGIVAGTASKPVDVALKTPDGGFPSPKSDSGPGDYELVFRPDPTVWDGRFANNGWLQELPKPISKLTWDNAAIVAPETAEKLKLGNEDVIELRVGSTRLQLPVWIVPGQAPGAIAVTLGYGRRRVGRVGNGAGFDVYPARTTAQPWAVAGVSVRKTGRKYELATTQHEQNMHDRDLIRVATYARYEQDPRFAPEKKGPEPEFAGDEVKDDTKGLTLYPGYDNKGYSGHAWGMTINLNTCIGCQTCTIACQAENNIPVVGKEQVIRGRSMHWIRVDRYYQGAPDNPGFYHQPVPCMHCETAPCELVCPVGATNHDDEGLNVMVYNRCVGTRYCSNNCPYKVRRFNFLQFTEQTTEVLRMANNPDVTVRTRGVMEKCTYCIQRINEARFRADVEGRPIGGDEVVPACAQACPTQAIVFGDINNPDSKVSKSKRDSRNYGILTELNTRPRTTYIAKLRNPNGAIETETAAPAESHDGHAS